MFIEQLMPSIVNICKSLHSGQTRKDGVTPYHTHPMAVAEWLLNKGVTNNVILAAALLHDTLEDCAIDMRGLYTAIAGTEHFSNKETRDVVALVVELTSRDKQFSYLKKALERTHRKAFESAYYGNYASYAACLIKAADRINNLDTLPDNDPGFVARFTEESIDLLGTLENALNLWELNTGGNCHGLSAVNRAVVARLDALAAKGAE